MGRLESVKRIGDSFADRLGISVWGLVAGLAAIASAGFGAWWALASPATAPAEETLPRVASTLPALTPTASLQPLTKPIVVDVVGAVVSPGVHELVEGARVHEAIAAASGFTPEADRSRLNLAAVLSDGDQVWVPKEGEQQPALVSVVSQGNSASPASGRIQIVNINTADASTLENLPGIGPSLAAAIVVYRQEHGHFTQPEGLLAVPGIGEAKLAGFVDFVAL